MKLFTISLRVLISCSSPAAVAVMVFSMFSWKVPKSEMATYSLRSVCSTFSMVWRTSLAFLMMRDFKSAWVCCISSRVAPPRAAAVSWEKFSAVRLFRLLFSVSTSR